MKNLKQAKILKKTKWDSKQLHVVNKSNVLLKARIFGEKTSKFCFDLFGLASHCFFGLPLTYASLFICSEYPFYITLPDTIG